MKRMIVIADKISYFLSFFYPYQAVQLLKIADKYIYSSKIKRKIKACGELFKIMPPIRFKGGEYMNIGKNFRAGSNLILECYNEYEGMIFQPYLQIGDNACLGNNCHIGCINSIVIGKNLLTGRNVYITDHFHGEGLLCESEVPPIKRSLYSKGQVCIGDNVWLGENVTIMPGVTIGNNVTIGANAVVTKSLPDNCVAAGVPAKVIRIKQ